MLQIKGCRVLQVIYFLNKKYLTTLINLIKIIQKSMVFLDNITPRRNKCVKDIIKAYFYNFIGCSIIRL